jgi:hypothetical protein
MSDKAERWAKADAIFQDAPGATRLARGVALLVKEGAGEDECRQWAVGRVKLYIGTAMPADECERAIRRGLGSVRPEAERAEPAPAPAPAVSAELAPVDIEVPDPEPIADPELPAAFTDAKQLLAIAVDATATKKRLADLERAQRELGKASERLAGHRSTFERRAQKVRAAIAEQQAELRKGWEALRQREYQFAEREKQLAAQLEDGRKWRGFADAQRYEKFPGTLVRDFGDRV